ncbi:MAG TPA: hypothetical protein VEB19_13585 [Gemmatimonadaceae bacterium]|nr:hypothetical protein [Gemmatimonadaceae bacterium]
MYSHCLFCKAGLGSNESVEHFPVGKRLAFDPAKGRLWVVCPVCARWNLTPIEERWEAIEECERHYRGQRLRAQTDNIGIAKLNSGLELVRIGPALRPEFAAWRYGRMFSARFRRRMVTVGAGTAVAGTGIVLFGAPVMAAIAALGPITVIGAHFILPIIATRGHLKSTRIAGQDGKLLRVTRANLEHAQLQAADGDDPWRLQVRHSYGKQELTGEVARRALGALLANVNRGGATQGTVQDATTIIADAGSPAAVSRMVAGESRKRSGDFAERWKAYERGDWMREPWKAAMEPINWREFYKTGQLNLANSNQMPSNPGALPRLPRAQRLALEMALHEDTEQTALEGELALLEAAWREAEEIAAIADNFFAPKIERVK